MRFWTFQHGWLGSLAHVFGQQCSLIGMVASNGVIDGVRSFHRRAHTPIRFTETLPTPEQCWLHDPEGNRYVSELRMVAVAEPEGASGVDPGA